ncbi:hypothetical protein Avbf_06400 [Armadillidium vulgare]|nr:hypothetical protein Avbf_06400 [Armadillidium vulgare]
MKCRRVNRKDAPDLIPNRGRYDELGVFENVVWKEATLTVLPMLTDLLLRLGQVKYITDVKDKNIRVSNNKFSLFNLNHYWEDEDFCAGSRVSLPSPPPRSLIKWYEIISNQYFDEKNSEGEEIGAQEPQTLNKNSERSKKIFKVHLIKFNYVCLRQTSLNL